jgi:Ala-tRNA(Pro) deacylase
MPGEALRRVLDANSVGYDVLPHEHTESAAAEAAALGVPAGQVAKTLVVSTPTGNVRAVLPASRRIDLRKLAEVYKTGRKSVQLASEDELARSYPDFELGAVPPVGGREDPVVIDRSLTERESIVLEAGKHDESVRLLTDDLVRLARATVADISQD